MHSKPLRYGQQRMCATCKTNQTSSTPRTIALRPFVWPIEIRERLDVECIPVKKSQLIKILVWLSAEEEWRSPTDIGEVLGLNQRTIGGYCSRLLKMHLVDTQVFKGTKKHPITYYRTTLDLWESIQTVLAKTPQMIEDTVITSEDLQWMAYYRERFAQRNPTSSLLGTFA
jgi:DNA-binding transcriptional ArsR family regulator